MSSFSKKLSTRRPTTTSPGRLDRSGEAPRRLPSPSAEDARPLPRHLLVSLARITTDVMTLQERNVEAPQLHAALGSILGQLDGLVDSIYGRVPDLE